MPSSVNFRVLVEVHKDCFTARPFLTAIPSPCGVEIGDQSLTTGLRGRKGAWDFDLSVATGRSTFQFNIENTNNASMGGASPTSFDAGQLTYRETTGNFDAVRLIDTNGALRSLSLVLGSEFRVENFGIGAGQFESYSLGNGGSVPGVDKDPVTKAFGVPDLEEETSINVSAGFTWRPMNNLSITSGPAGTTTARSSTGRRTRPTTRSSEPRSCSMPTSGTRSRTALRSGPASHRAGRPAPEARPYARVARVIGTPGNRPAGRSRGPGWETGW